MVLVQGGSSEQIGTSTTTCGASIADKTAAFMQKVDKPWVAFKVMAAGAIQPQMAFNFAYRNGADFIVAGMFDFQVEEDVKIALDVLRKIHDRERPWRA